MGGVSQLERNDVRSAVLQASSWFHSCELPGLVPHHQRDEVGALPAKTAFHVKPGYMRVSSI